MTAAHTASPRGRLTRLEVRNYRNVAHAAVRLGDLTVLVGPTGAGSSSLVDALVFVSEALRYGLAVAFRRRGGIGAVRRRSRGHPYNVGVDLQMAWPDGTYAQYAFDVAARSGERFEVWRERCHVQGFLEGPQGFELRDGLPLGAAVALSRRRPRDDLALRHVDGPPALVAVRALATSIGCYAPDPVRMRTPVLRGDPREPLDADAGNAANVLAAMLEDRAQAVSSLTLRSTLARVAPGMVRLDVASFGSREALVAHHSDGIGDTWQVDADSLPDGVLRAFGHLLAVHQARLPAAVALEEPESGLHPGATGAVADALLEASNRTQVLVTTHDSSFVTHPGIADDAIVVVGSERGSAVFEQPRRDARERAHAALNRPSATLAPMGADRASARSERASDADTGSRPAMRHAPGRLDLANDGDA